MKIFSKCPNRVSIFLLAAVCGFIPLLPISAMAVSNAISRTYKTTDNKLTAGMAVSLSRADGSDQTTVVATSPENSKQFVGITSYLEDNLVTLTGSASDVVVTTSGQVDGLVSDVNGMPKKGDILISSPIEGVLMRADTSLNTESYPAVAVAAGEIKDVSQKTIKDRSDRDQQVSIGVMPIDLSTGISGKTDYYSHRKTFMVVFVQSLTGKVVSEWQALGAFTVFLAIILTDCIIIYGTIHSAITAIGRNPLSRKSVINQVVQVCVLAFGVFALGCFAIFIILWF